MSRSPFQPSVLVLLVIVGVVVGLVLSGELASKPRDAAGYKALSRLPFERQQSRRDRQ